CHPDDTIVTGSARKVRLTKPPSVATAHAATKTTKNATPRATAAAAPTGTSGLTAAGSLDEACVDDRVDVRHRLDDAQLQQELGRVAAEGLQLAGEELGVGRAVLPAQVRLRLLELLAGLLDRRAHDLEALLGLGPDHVHRVEVAVHQGLDELGVLVDELRRAA